LKLVEEMDMSSDDEEEDSKLVKNVEGKLFFINHVQNIILLQ
jgi:hypothetical protein